MKIITFDIEEWYLRQEKYGSEKSKYLKLDGTLKTILDLLERRNIKATFFCLGGMARDFPEVVMSIKQHGHEIGCHSNEHRWLNKMSINDVKEDTRISIDILEQCVGQKIKSYRAPAFSIGESNKWAFEILVENGIENDASIFPLNRDFGGFPSFDYKEPVSINYKGNIIHEFPVCTTYFMGKELVYSGGGYFRFFPLWFIQKELKKTNYAMTYFHLGDLIPESSGVMTREAYEAYFNEPGTLKARYMRHLKYNFGKKNSFSKLVDLIKTNDFINIKDANKQINWSERPIVEL